MFGKGGSIFGCRLPAYCRYYVQRAAAFQVSSSLPGFFPDACDHAAQMAENSTPPDSTSGDVMSSLPHRRPNRRSERRNQAGTASKRGPRAASTAKPATSKPNAAKPATKKAPARSPKPRIASGSSPAAAPGAVPFDNEPPPKARIRAERPAIPGGGRTRPPEPGSVPPPATSGPELVETAIKATGELAQIGLRLSSELVKNAVRRLPRP